MKYRIVEYKNGWFALQYRIFFVWFDVEEKIGTSAAPARLKTKQEAFDFYIQKIYTGKNGFDVFKKYKISDMEKKYLRDRGQGSIKDYL